jgi:hypothetical protein
MSNNHIATYNSAVYALQLLHIKDNTGGKLLEISGGDILFSALRRGSSDGKNAAIKITECDNKHTTKVDRRIPKVPIDKDAIEKDINKKLEDENGRYTLYTEYSGYIIGFEELFHTTFNSLRPLMQGETDNFVRTMHVHGSWLTILDDEE